MKRFIEIDELSQYPKAFFINVTLGNDQASGDDHYLGLEEPLYNEASHIPHAKSYYYELVYDDKGYMRSQKSL
ncbi:hypothetical protein [Facklamia sp. P12955]|uniref:hypothetical protein n=1 Tax=unclassified Facklamia TaxID=2622293 RepID=UPI003D16338B